MTMAIFLPYPARWAKSTLRATAASPLSHLSGVDTRIRLRQHCSNIVRSIFETGWPMNIACVEAPQIRKPEFDASERRR
jgi:hypothetical protein